MSLHGDVGRLVGAYLEAESVLLTDLPNVVGRVDEELRVPVICSIVDRMYLHTARAVKAYAVLDAVDVFLLVAVIADKTRGVVALAVAVLHEVGPDRPRFRPFRPFRSFRAF